MATNIHAVAVKPPGLASAPAEEAATFFDALVRVETRMYNGLNDALRERCGLAASQYELLRFIEAHPAARVADLARTFAIGLGAASKGVDRLEARSWVRRVPNPHDRRSSLLELTQLGRDALAPAQQTFEQWLLDLLGASTTPEDLAATNGVLRRLQQRLEDRGIGTPTG